MMTIQMAATILAMTAAPATAPREAPIPIVQASQADTRRYCVVDTVTGSHIPVKVCHTRADWLDRGVEMPAAK